MKKRKISYIEPALLVPMQFVSFQTVLLQHTTFNQLAKFTHINCPLLFFKAHLTMPLSQECDNVVLPEKKRKVRKVKAIQEARQCIIPIGTPERRVWFSATFQVKLLS
jgi:hypothetical protein